jgi:hypothetical protein
MEEGTYVLSLKGGVFRGFVAEICPACNGGKVVGGLSSPIAPCPVCNDGEHGSSGVVLVEVPTEEAQAWIDRQLAILKRLEVNDGSDKSEI